VLHIIDGAVLAGTASSSKFPITDRSIAATSIELEYPIQDYLEGDPTLDLSGLLAKVNYCNDQSHYVAEFPADSSTFEPELYDL
jgi:hypothetical protein